jgi:hypothetical protein
VPDLTDAVAVGTMSKESEDVGRRVEGTLGRQAIGGDQFALPEPTQGRTAADRGNAENPFFKGGLVVVATVNPGYLKVQDNSVGWGGYGNTNLDVFPAYDRFHPAGTKLGGTVTIQPPTHVKIRARIRIR